MSEAGGECEAFSCHETTAATLSLHRQDGVMLSENQALAPTSPLTKQYSEIVSYFNYSESLNLEVKLVQDEPRSAVLNFPFL